MRTVQAALVATAQGLDPQIENFADPWNRKMNYPSPWIWIAKTFNFQTEINYLLFVSVTVLAYLYVCGAIMFRCGSLWLLPLIFSGGSLLAVERGNNDLVVFLLLFIAAHASSRLRPLPLLLATALKLYPIVAFPILIRDKGVLIVFAISSVILIGFLWPEIALIRDGTPSAAQLSYGSASLSVLALRDFEVAIPSIFITVFLGILVAFFVWIQRSRFVVPSTFKNGLEERLYILGACIYCGSFVLSSNWDYRLIFLIFCLPYVLSFSDQKTRYFVLVCLVFSANQLLMVSILGSVGFYVNIAAKCALFILLGAITFLTLKDDFVFRGRALRSWI